MDDDNVIDLTEATLNRLRNLRPNKGKTDEEIKEAYRVKHSVTPSPPNTTRYDKLYNKKLELLKSEYAVDMNNSNDVETLNNLVRHQIQLEQVNNDIESVQRKSTRSVDDYKNMKSLGDFQRNILISLNDLQSNLGISRKQRKEKNVDDIPQWIDGILKRSKEFMDVKTTVVTCPRCKIELARFWLNFRNTLGAINRKPLNNDIQFSLQCWKCEEQVEHIQ